MYHRSIYSKASLILPDSSRVPDSYSTCSIKSPSPPARRVAAWYHESLGAHKEDLDDLHLTYRDPLWGKILWNLCYIKRFSIVQSPESSLFQHEYDSVFLMVSLRCLLKVLSLPKHFPTIFPIPTIH